MKNAAQVHFPDCIETERLYLRSYRAGDGPMYYAAGLRNRQHFAEFESGNILMQIKNEEHAEAVVRSLAADWAARRHFFLGIFEKETETWAGQVYVGPTNWELPEFVIGYVADVNREGKGYITEAVRGVLRVLFDDLGAHRVRSECADTNPRSYRVLERCGFTREGHFRENKRNPDGSFRGDYHYGLLKGEFETRYPGRQPGASHTLPE